MSHHTKIEKPVILSVHYIVLTLFLLAAFFPQNRLWGVNWWAYFPAYVPFVLFAVGALAPIVMCVTIRRGRPDIDEDRVSAEGNSRYSILVCCMTVLWGFGFYLLRARTHFLGDGYTALASLASDNPLIKPRALGEALVHIWLKSAIGGDAEMAALLSYQLISMSAGVLFLVVLALASKWLFDRAIGRVLFWLGSASSGYVLLFFGYVENYSLFVMSAAVYSLLGLLVAKGKVNRWLVFPFVSLAIFFHVLGVMLIPSAIYLLVTNSKLGNSLSGLSRKTKLLITAVTAIIAALLFHYYYSTDYFFRFAFVPLFEDRFTVEGYTLLSTRHLMDYFNLLMLLLPGVPLVVATLLFLPIREMLKRREHCYLLILLASTLGAAFVLDPKLGMPRDWDLFSFSGVPLATFSYFLLLDRRNDKKQYPAVVTLAILVGFLSLFPRVISQTSTRISLAHFEDYLRQDRRKNKTARVLLINHYERLGDHESAQFEREKMVRDFPEKHDINRAKMSFKQRRFSEAIYWCDNALEKDPICFDAYAIAGVCFLEMDRNDTAQTLLEIADGLNPYNPIVLNNLGTAYLRKGQFRRAEKALLQSIKHDPGFDKPVYSLANLYIHRGDIDKSFAYFEKLKSIEGVPPEYFGVLGDNYAGKGRFDKAARAYRQGLIRGLDSTYVNRLIEKHAPLKEHFLQLGTSHDSLGSQR